MASVARCPIGGDDEPPFFLAFFLTSIDFLHSSLLPALSAFRPCFLGVCGPCGWSASHLGVYPHCAADVPHGPTTAAADVSGAAPPVGAFALHQDPAARTYSSCAPGRLVWALVSACVQRGCRRLFVGGLSPRRLRCARRSSFTAFITLLTRLLHSGTRVTFLACAAFLPVPRRTWEEHHSASECWADEGIRLTLSCPPQSTCVSLHGRTDEG